MSRYIDADALKTKFENKKSTIQNRIMGGQMDSIAIAFYEIFIEAIDKQPTVDAVQVVRCKECIEYRESVGACHYFNYEPTDEMDFCSHGIRVDGKRKDGERKNDGTTAD